MLALGCNCRARGERYAEWLDVVVESVCRSRDLVNVGLSYEVEEGRAGSQPRTQTEHSINQSRCMCKIRYVA